MNTKRTFRPNFESLESRTFLSVSAFLSNGNLRVEGDAAGAIVITALDADTYRVTDNAVEVAEVDGVRKSVRINLGAADDVVTLDLKDQEVRKHVFANLGEGNNQLNITGVPGRSGRSEDGSTWWCGHRYLHGLRRHS